MIVFRWILSIIVMIIAMPLYAAEGTFLGTLAMYTSVQTEKTEEGTKQVTDMTGLPILGYNHKTQAGNAEVEGQVRIWFEDGTYDVLDLWATATYPGAQLFFGHNEFMDRSLGIQHFGWLDQTYQLGIQGIEGRDDIFRFSIFDLHLRLGVNQQPEVDTAGEASNSQRNFTGLEYRSEGQSFSFVVGATAAQDKIDTVYNSSLVGTEADGRAQTAGYGGVLYQWAEGNTVALNTESAIIQSGVIGADPVKVSRSVLSVDVTYGESSGATINLGAQSSKDNSANPLAETQTDITFYTGYEALTYWLGYSGTTAKDTDDAVDSMAANLGLGVTYDF